VVRARIQDARRICIPEGDEMTMNGVERPEKLSLPLHFKRVIGLPG